MYTPGAGNAILPTCVIDASGSRAVRDQPRLNLSLVSPVPVTPGGWQLARSNVRFRERGWPSLYGRLLEVTNGCFVDVQREKPRLSVGQLRANPMGGFGSAVTFRAEVQQLFDRARVNPDWRRRAQGAGHRPSRPLRLLYPR